MWKIVKIPIADWLPYPPPLYINIGFGLRDSKSPAKIAIVSSLSINVTVTFKDRDWSVQWMTHPAFPAFFQFGYVTFGYNRLWIHHFFVFHNRIDPIFFFNFHIFRLWKIITVNAKSVIFSVNVHRWFYHFRWTIFGFVLFILSLFIIW